jgi:hypothetical protein
MDRERVECEIGAALVGHRRHHRIRGGGRSPWAGCRERREARVNLVGREVELTAVRAALEADIPAVVLGEAGIGKTALVRAAIEATGRRAYEGGGFATLAWKPYLALSRAIGRSVDGDHAAAAASVERSVGPDVLFVDDLQWADRETRAVVALLAGRIGLVAAVRDGDPEAPAALAPLTEAGARMILVRGLDASSAAALAAALRPDLSGQAVEHLVRRAGGNPLLLEELASRGQPSRTLAQAIARQLDTLAAPEREVLEVLAIAERPLPTATLGPAGRRLAAMGLVHEVRDGLEVRHALIAEAIVAGLAEDVRAARHRHVARLVAEPAEVARHLLAGGRARRRSGSR